MADTDPLRRYIEAGLALTQLTRARAEALVKELVKAGDLQREHAQERVEELLDRSRKSTDGLAGVIRKEMAQQLSSMGFATREDLEKLEQRMERRLATMGTAGGGAKAATPKSTGKAAPASRPSRAAPPAKASSAAKVAPASRPSKAATAPPGTAARKATAPKNPGRRGPATGATPAPS